jgi:hypothetical protein
MAVVSRRNDRKRRRRFSMELGLQDVYVFDFFTNMGVSRQAVEEVRLTWVNRGFWVMIIHERPVWLVGPMKSNYQGRRR